MRSRVVYLLLIFAGVVSLCSAVGASHLVTGSLELTRWSSITLTNKTAMFYTILASVGFLFGLLQSRFKSVKIKLLLMAGMLLTVFLLGNVLSRAMPFRVV